MEQHFGEFSKLSIIKSNNFKNFYAKDFDNYESDFEEDEISDTKKEDKNVYYLTLYIKI